MEGRFSSHFSIAGCSDGDPKETIVICSRSTEALKLLAADIQANGRRQAGDANCGRVVCARYSVFSELSGPAKQWKFR